MLSTPRAAIHKTNMQTKERKKEAIVPLQNASSYQTKLTEDDGNKGSFKKHSLPAYLDELLLAPSEGLPLAGKSLTG